MNSDGVPDAAVRDGGLPEVDDQRPDTAAGLPAWLQVGGRADPPAARHGAAKPSNGCCDAAQVRQQPDSVQAAPDGGGDTPGRMRGRVSVARWSAATNIADPGLGWER